MFLSKPVCGTQVDSQTVFQQKAWSSTQMDPQNLYEQIFCGTLKKGPQNIWSGSSRSFPKMDRQSDLEQNNMPYPEQKSTKCFGAIPLVVIRKRTDIFVVAKASSKQVLAKNNVGMNKTPQNFVAQYYYLSPKSHNNICRQSVASQNIS